MYETIWDTRNFNDPKDWPVDGSQPFVWSMNDKYALTSLTYRSRAGNWDALTLKYRSSTGYGTHGDYVFGWKGDALQRAMDAACYVNCPTLKTQSMTAMNACSIKSSVNEDVDSCELFALLSCSPSRDRLLTSAFRASEPTGL
jgi:hypothetical protein